MKLSTLLELIGSGWLLLVAGVSVLVLGLGYGLNSATNLPIWACLVAMGLFTLIVGVALVGRGGEKAEQQVKAMPLFTEVLQHPWTAIGATVVGGLLFYRLIRGRPKVIVERITPAQAVETDLIRKTDGTTTTTKSSSFSLSSLLGDHLQELGAKAGEMAIKLGMQAFGVPPLKTLISDLLAGTGQKETVPAGERESPSDFSRPKEYAGTASGGRGPSHNGNGSNRSEFDPTVG